MYVKYCGGCVTAYQSNKFIAWTLENVWQVLGYGQKGILEDEKQILW